LLHAPVGGGCKAKKNCEKIFRIFSPNFLHTISMLVIMMGVCKHDAHCCSLTSRDFAWVGSWADHKANITLAFTSAVPCTVPALLGSGQGLLGDRNRGASFFAVHDEGSSMARGVSCARGVALKFPRQAHSCTGGTAVRTHHGISPNGLGLQPW